MDILLGAPVRLQPFFGYRNRERLRISARALRSAKPGFDSGGRLQAMRTMLAQFASREVAELPVAMEIAHDDGEIERHEALTDKEGYVHFDVILRHADPWPPHPAWETVTFHWRNRTGEQSVDGHVLMPGANSTFGVISDIDDTVMETGITGGMRQLARNWRRVLAELPDERLLVPGADLFYNALGGSRLTGQAGGDHTGEKREATQNPFFYISSSPWNLFSYLVAFKRGRGLPLGPLMLRDWGLNSQTFGKSSHGAHKIAAIDAVLGTYPELQFALIGDDTQGDLVAFGNTVRKHGTRIKAVFIRKAGEAMNAEELDAKSAITAAGVPLWLGDDWSTGEAFLREIGLRGDGEAETIVKTVERVAETGEKSSAAAE